MIRLFLVAVLLWAGLQASPAMARIVDKGMQLYNEFQYNCNISADCAVLEGVCPSSYMTVNRKYILETQQLIANQAPYVECALPKRPIPVPAAACDGGRCKLPPHVPPPIEKEEKKP